MGKGLSVKLYLSEKFGIPHGVCVSDRTEKGKDKKAEESAGGHLHDEGPWEPGGVTPTFHLLPSLIQFALLQSLN